MIVSVLTAVAYLVIIGPAAVVRRIWSLRPRRRLSTYWISRGELPSDIDAWTRPW